jgi:hypothetical protein
MKLKDLTMLDPINWIDGDNMEIDGDNSRYFKLQFNTNCNFNRYNNSLFKAIIKKQ